MHLRRVIVVLASLAPAAALAFGMPKVPGGGGGGGLTGAQIDNFVTLAVAADADMTDSAYSLFEAVATKEEKDAIEAKVKAAQTTGNAKEDEASVKDAKKSALASLESCKWDDAMAARIGELSAEQRDAVVTAAGGFIGAAVKNVGLVKQGQELAKQKPDMRAAPKMPELTASVGNLVNQTKSAANVATNVVKLCQSAKIELPASATASIDQLKGGL